ncbi:MAG: hypothetical protein Tsb009_12990 [Planctomycetaceae bacterium]
MIRTKMFRSLQMSLIAFLILVVSVDQARIQSFAADEYATQSGAFIAAPMDWPFWRGPEMNGISREKNIVSKWSQRGQNLLWFNKEAAGRSTPIVMNGKLYLLVRDQPETKKEGEKVLCLDAATGKKLWENRFNVFQSDVPDTRVGWSSVVGDPKTGDVFALGVCGYFQCIDGNTGRTKWSHSLSEEYGLLSTYGGRTNFPIIHGNLVIISAIIIGWGDMAKPAHRFIAFDKRNGQPVWFEGTRILPFDTTYSTPIITVFNGQAAMVFGSGDGGLHAFQPQTGKKLWSYVISPKRGINTTPLIVGNQVFCGHAEENPITNPNEPPTMGALLSVDLKTGKQIWRHNQWFVGKSAPLHVNGRIYAAENGGNLRIVDAKTGNLISTFRLGGAMHGSPLYVDGKIYIGTTNGRWWVLEPTSSGVKVLDRQRLRNNGGMYASPIVSHGRLYIPTVGGLYCVGDKNQKPSADKRPDPPQEAELSTDTKPAQLQVVPVESLLKPGQRQQFQVRLYNARGQFLRLADAKDVKFSMTGPGKIDANGKYHSLNESDKGSDQHAAVIVTASANGLTGKARIRVVPDLPWNVDFNNGEIPITWVGVRYRHIPLDYKLYSELEKQNLLAARLYIYLQTGVANGQPGNKTGNLIYNNRSPRRTFHALLEYLGMERDVDSLKSAQDKLNPLLKMLADEEFIGKISWSESPETGIQLVVEKGKRKITDGGVMVKIKTIPKGQRSQGWMGHPDFSDYTIQADVLGAERVSVVNQGGSQRTIRKMPDIGLAGQRYVLDMMGAKQQLQIRTWHPQLRMANSVPFSWKPNVWYTLKMKCSVKDGMAVLQAKCWERGTPEPKNWMLEARDESPNRNGSPGLFGNAVDAEIFYDNIKVYKN